MLPNAQPKKMVHLVAAPYPQRLLATTKPALASVCQRWLTATGQFDAGRPLRPVIGGVVGTFAEHLARMMSSARETDLEYYDVWSLLRDREAARNWSDEATFHLLDEVIRPSVFVEVFAPDALLGLQAPKPAAQWWIEGPADSPRPSVRTRGTVTRVLQQRLAAHLGVTADDLIPTVLDAQGVEFGRADDQPIEGLYTVRLRFGAGRSGVP